MAEAGKRKKPWSRQLLNFVESGRRPMSIEMAQDVGRYLGIGPEAALLIAGHMPWLPTVDQAQQVVRIFKNGAAAT